MRWPLSLGVVSHSCALDVLNERRFWNMTIREEVGWFSATLYNSLFAVLAVVANGWLNAVATLGQDQSHPEAFKLDLNITKVGYLFMPKEYQPISKKSYCMRL